MAASPSHDDIHAGQPAETAAGSRSDTNQHEQARAAYRRSLVEQRPLTGVELGELFGHSDRWARQRIAEVHRDATATVSQSTGMPAETPSVGQQRSPSDSATAHPTARETEISSQTAVGKPRKARPSSARGKAIPERAPWPTTGSDRPSLDQRNRNAPVGYWWALGSFLGGALLSVAANVAHAFHAPASYDMSDLHAAYTPDPGSIVAAACWPLLLLGAVEVISRVAWPRGLWWGAARYGGAVTVASIAAVMSYRHMSGLLTDYGEDSLGAHLGPLAVDGLMVVAGFALLATRPRRSAIRRRRDHAASGDVA